MRIITWNVNGLRARIKNGFEKAIEKMNPDILCLQEVRATNEQLPRDFLPDYHKYFSIHEKAGYAGSAIFMKKGILPSKTMCDFDEGVESGRVCMANFLDFLLISSYTPNSGNALEKLDYRTQWEQHLCDHIKNQKCPVILCGDLNVAPFKIDNNTRNKAGTSFQERSAFQNILNLGLTDVWRELHPSIQEFSWFSNMADSREKNRGMRLDHFVISNTLLRFVKNCEILHEPSLVCKSDHEPVLLEIDLEV